MILINGKQENRIPVSDRGIQYGDGVFETIAVIQGTPRLLERHLARLESSCKQLAIPYPGNAILQGEITQVCGDAKTRQVLKIIITRGSGGRGYKPSADTFPTRILSLHPWPDYPQEWADSGIQTRLCKHPISINPVLAGIKHLNRLDQVLASMEWQDPSIAEGIMLDQYKHVIEGTRSNIFIVKDKVLITPELSSCGVKGIMRSLLMDLAKQLSITVIENTLSLEELNAADEVFMCNSIIGIWPVNKIEQHVFNTNRPVCDSLKNKLLSEKGFTYTQVFQGSS